MSGANCPQLSAPVHGNIKGYRRETGSTVRVSCDSGYKVEPDSSSFRTCQADNLWSGADPVCKRKKKSLQFGLPSYFVPLFLVILIFVMIKQTYAQQIMLFYTECFLGICISYLSCLGGAGNDISPRSLHIIGGLRAVPI